jgi:hypothetical protein
MDETNIFSHHLHSAARAAADFQDSHARRLLERNGLKLEDLLAHPHKLKELGYVLNQNVETRGNCKHYELQLLKIVDTEEYSIKYSVEPGL